MLASQEEFLAAFGLVAPVPILVGPSLTRSYETTYDHSSHVFQLRLWNSLHSMDPSRVTLHEESNRQAVPMTETDPPPPDNQPLHRHDSSPFRVTSPYASYGGTLIRPNSFADDFENGILPDTPERYYQHDQQLHQR